MTAFIFDLDGTLADSIPNILDVAKRSFAQLGKTVSEDTIIEYVGIPLIQTGEDLLGPGRGREYADAYMETYAKTVFDLQAFPGMDRMLSDLEAAGAALGVCTSKRRQPAHESLEKIGLKKYFSAIINCESGYGCKPEAGPALGAADELATPPGECYFIGDSIHDIACGKNAGMGTVGVTWGASSEKAFREIGADYICHDADQLRKLLLSLV